MQERGEAMRLANARAAEQQAAADALRSEAVEAAAAGDDLRIMVGASRVLVSISGNAIADSVKKLATPWRRPPLAATCTSWWVF